MSHAFVDEIQRYLTGAWRMMMGKADGLRLLDLSADGFWNSFFAIVVALPALIVGWVGVANEIGAIRRCIRRPALDPDRGWRWSTSAPGSLPLVVPCPRRAARRHWRPLRPLCRRQQLGVGAHRLADAAGGAAQACSARPARVRRSCCRCLCSSLSMVLTWRLTNVAIGKGAGCRQRCLRRHVPGVAGRAVRACRRCSASVRRISHLG